MTDKTIQSPRIPKNPQSHFGGYSDKGPVRSGNEDTFWIPDENTPTNLGELFIVADGVGGQQHGRAAADRAALTIHTVFYQLRQAEKSIHDAIKEAVLKANTAVIEESQQLGGGKMGSTIVTCVQKDDAMIITHVGDARAYLLRQGNLRQLTRDDSWVQRQVDAGLLTSEEAANHELRNVVTQVLGNKLDITVHISEPIPAEAGDLVLLCSDGLYDVLSNQQMSDIMINNSPQAASEILVQTAAAGGAKDNITAVITRFGPADAVLPLAATIPTDITVQDTQPPTPPVQETTSEPPRKTPSWLPLLIAGLLIIVVLFILGIWIWNSGALGSSSSGEEPIATLPVESTAVPIETIPPATNTVSALQPVVTPALIPTATPRPTETAVSINGITIGSTVIISGTVVNIRSEPITAADNILFEVFQNTALTVTDGPAEGSGFTWWKVRLNDGREGWSAADFLELAPIQ